MYAPSQTHQDQPPLEVEIANSCPFCKKTHEVLWVPKQNKTATTSFDGCRFCGQPKIVTPSGAYALSTKQIHLSNDQGVRMYVLAKGRVEFDILDSRVALMLYEELGFALIKAGLIT